MSILAVEDDATQQYVLRVVFESFGMQADIVSSAERAIDYLFNQKRDYSLVLMDIRLPGMDGFDCTREIRQRQQKSKFKIPIIAVTAYASIDDRALCLAAGMDDYISKPYELEAFKKLINKHLEQSHGFRDQNQNDSVQSERSQY